MTDEKLIERFWSKVEPTGDYPDAEGQHALRHPDDWVGADD